MREHCGRKARTARWQEALAFFGMRPGSRDDGSRKRHRILDRLFGGPAPRGRPETAPSTEAAQKPKDATMAAPSAASEPVRGMRVVAEQYEKLEHVVGSLNSKTRDLLLRERKEFLAAYRAHSFRIQDELQELRAKVQAEQSSSRKDEKVRRLKEDCDWFRREALRLDEEGTKMTQELHKLKTQLDDSERDRSWLLNELSRTQTTTELLAVKIADAEARRNEPPTPEPEDDGEDDDSAPVVVLSPRERLRRDREEKAEIAKRRKQKVQVAHQVADRIKECERYERQIAEERDRVRPPTEESRLLQTEFLEAVLAVSREKDVRLGIDDRTHGAPAADPETGEPDVSLIEPIELDRGTSIERRDVMSRFLAMPTAAANPNKESVPAQLTTLSRPSAKRAQRSCSDGAPMSSTGP